MDLDYLIANLVSFYHGGAGSFREFGNMPVAQLFNIHDCAVRINREREKLLKEAC